MERIVKCPNCGSQVKIKTRRDEGSGTNPKWSKGKYTKNQQMLMEVLVNSDKALAVRDIGKILHLEGKARKGLPWNYHLIQMDLSVLVGKEVIKMERSKKDFLYSFNNDSKKKQKTLRSDQIQISAKNLGDLKNPHFCQRCFWIKTHQKPLPYQIFPGIFNSIDAYTKNIISGYINKEGKLPDWLKDIGEVTKIFGNATDAIKDKPPKFSTFYKNVIITGIPDAIYQRPNGNFLIIDYKTARYTEGQDKMLPIYKIQLNGYAYIAEKLGISIEGLYIIYFEPPEKEKDYEPKNITTEGFAMPFKSTIHKISKDTQEIETLMDEAYRLYSLVSPPEGVKDCKDCRSVVSLSKFINNGNQMTIKEIYYAWLMTLILFPIVVVPIAGLLNSIGILSNIQMGYVGYFIISIEAIIIATPFANALIRESAKVKANRIESIAEMMSDQMTKLFFAIVYWSLLLVGMAFGFLPHLNSLGLTLVLGDLYSSLHLF